MLSNPLFWLVLISVIALLWHPWSRNKQLTDGSQLPKARVQSLTKQETGCCERCGTYHPEPEENCPRANR